MFYYLFNPYLAYDLILVAAAVIPAVFLMVRVYKLDHLEPESRSLIWRLIKAGIFASLIALLLEKLLSELLARFLSPASVLYRVLLYFVVVGISEEGSKLFELKLTTWKHREFDCLFDGVLYAVFVSLGFAMWENISYILNYGLGASIIRALTAIPGHASFGVFMGVFYAAAKLSELSGEKGKSVYYLVLSLVVPLLLHGAYDYIATSKTSGSEILFIIFILILFLGSNLIIRGFARNDRFLS